MTDNAETTPLPPVVHEPVPLPHFFFWFAYYAGGLLPLFYAAVALGESGLFAVYLQASAAIWVFGFLFQICERYAWAWICASIWVMLLAIPFGWQVIRRLHFWITVGMELPDGTGSPAAFLLGFIFEWVIFGPVLYMLGVLLFYSPLHLRRRAKVASAEVSVLD